MELSYKEYGDQKGPLLVFLHGGGVGGWMWNKQAQYFNSFHCLVPDLPGHGRNQHTLHFSIKDSARQMLALIKEKAAGKQVHLIGFSLGAQISLQMLSDEPDLIHSAMINSALVRPLPLARLVIRPAIKLVFPLTKNRRFAMLQANYQYISDDDFEQYYRDSCEMKRDTLIEILEENSTFVLPDSFSQSTARILITVGEKEKGVMWRSARDIVRAYPDCTGVMIPEVGHGAPLADPDTFNRMTESWLLYGQLPGGWRRI